MDVNIKCNGCGMVFPLSNKTARWFKDKGMDIPKRCPECREKRKILRGVMDESS